MKTIKLTKENRQQLEKFTTKGIHSARLIRRAKIIPTLDEANNKKSKQTTQSQKKTLQPTNHRHNKKKLFTI
ncbi:MAG: hypothetical protein LBI79_09045 [Nitrososphaerota archaeon]|jgi:flagellar biosynthesis chaperone FliJ|nr:hypothetical protein [Nitrososphaerota archaeon]